jgi:hypothetical protein
VLLMLPPSSGHLAVGGHVLMHRALRVLASGRGITCLRAGWGSSADGSVMTECPQPLSATAPGTGCT